MASQSVPIAFATLVRQRRSCRQFLPAPVPREDIERMLEAARLAPSACNRQPWRFAVALSPESRSALIRHGLRPGLGLAQWLATAPVLIVLGIRRETAVHRLAAFFAGVDFAALDAGIAGEHLVLQAEELGLGACWIGWIRPSAARRAVGWPRSVQPVAIIAAGRPAENAPVQEQGERRKPLAELCRWLERGENRTS